MQQARETRAPWTDTSVNNRLNLLLKLDKLGFQPSNQRRQDRAPWTDISVYDK